MITEAPAQIPVSPSVLREARRRATLGIEQAVNAVNKLLKRDREQEVDAQDLEAWEDGQSRPTVAQAEALARAYLVPFVALFQRELPPLAVTDFRLGPGGRAAPLSYETREKLNRLQRFYAAAKRITAELGIAEDVSIQDARLDDVVTSHDIEGLALRVRSALQVSDESQLSWEGEDAALDAWREGIEGTGVFVFALPMAVDECRGASLWEAGGPPAILRNTADLTAAQLFTLIHEYAHLMFAKTGRDLTLCDPSTPAQHTEERIADRLAAATLLPRTLVERHLPATIPSANYSLWPPSERRRLSRELKVSQSAIGIRLRELGFVRYAGSSFWRRPSTFMRGRRRPAWQQYRRYLGVRTTVLARRAIEADVISSSELSRILDMKVKDVEALVG